MEDPTPQPSDNQIMPLPVRGTPEMFDINILPDRYRRKRLTFMMILPWLLLLILAGSIYPTYTMAVETQTIFQEKRLDLAQTQVKLDFFQTNTEERELLQSQIEEATQERDQILESYGGLRLSWEYWSPALKQIQGALPEGIALSYLSRQENAYRLEGISSQYQLVVALSDSLGEIPALDQVQIDSIERIEEEDAPVLPPQSLPETGTEETEAEVPASAPIYYSFTILFNDAEEVEP